MSNFSLAERPATAAPEPDEPVYGPCFSSARPPLPMGCRLCGHPPYEHGCDHMGAHEYEAPTRRQIDARRDLIRLARLDELGMPARDWVRPTKCAPAAAGTEAVAQPRPMVPAPRAAEPSAAAALPVESHQDRQARFARATEPRAMQRALAVAAVDRMARLENEWLLARVLRLLDATADHAADGRRVGARRLRRRPGDAQGASFPRTEYDQRRPGRVVARQPSRDELAGVAA